MCKLGNYIKKFFSVNAERASITAHPYARVTAYTFSNKNKLNGSIYAEIA